MSVKHLHFEKAFLPWAQNRIRENVFPVVLRDANVKPAARDIELAGMRSSPPRIKTRRKRTER